jgi:hypothetical protein
MARKKNYGLIGCLAALLYFPFGVIMALSKKYK